MAADLARWLEQPGEAVSDTPSVGLKWMRALHGSAMTAGGLLAALAAIVVAVVMTGDRRLTDRGRSPLTERSQTAPATNLTASPVTPATPAPLDCTGVDGASALEVRQAQKAWADWLGKKVVESVDLGGGVVLKLVLIPPGTFTMGSPAREEGRFDDEGPVHEVELTQPFWVGKFEVTRGQFRRFVEATHYRTDAEKEGRDCTWRKTSFEQTEEHPVVHVSWNDAAAFCDWLSRQAGTTARLPTEAEWEYSCRAGTTTRFSSGAEESSLQRVANIADQTARAEPAGSSMEAVSWEDGFAFTAPVESNRLPNAFGLCDMHGNVWEWCADWHDKYPAGRQRDPQGPATGSLRVRRGGSFEDMPRNCRSAARGWIGPGYQDQTLGFRIVLVRLGGTP